MFSHQADLSLMQMLRALKGENVVECSFVKSNLTEAAYFATPLKLGVSVP